MGKHILYLLLMIPFSLSAQIAEVRTYGGALFDEGRQILETVDGYIMVGTTSSVENGNSDISVIRLYDDLTVMWSATYGGIGADLGRSICKREAGGFFILGQTNFGTIGEYDIVLYTIDDAGNQMDETFFGTEDWDLPVRMVSSGDAYYIGATTYGTANGGTDQLILKVDDSGTLMDSFVFDVFPDGELGDMKWYDDHLYTIGTRTFDDGMPEGVVRKISAEGQLIWQDIRNETSTHGYAIAISPFGVAASYSITDEAQDNTLDAFTVCLNAETGDEVWATWSNQPDPGNQRVRAVVWSVDEAVFFAETDVYGNGGTGVFVERLFYDLGFWLGGTVFGGEQNETPYDALIDSQGRMLMLGASNSYGVGSFDFYLIRTPNEEVNNDYTLEIEDYVNVIVTDLDEYTLAIGSPFPNPATEMIYLPTTIHEVCWSLYSPTGLLIEDGRGTSVDVSHLATGAYLLKWGNDTKITVSKVLVQ